MSQDFLPTTQIPKQKLFQEKKKKREETNFPCKQTPNIATWQLPVPCTNKKNLAGLHKMEAEKK